MAAHDTAKGKCAERFKELSDKASNRGVKVELYPNSTLYKDKEEMEALQLGAAGPLAGPKLFGSGTIVEEGRT